MQHNYFPFFLENFVIKVYNYVVFLCNYNQKKKIGYHLKNKSCPLPINV
jgi:hypothetical protein